MNKTALFIILLLILSIGVSAYGGGGGFIVPVTKQYSYKSAEYQGYQWTEVVHKISPDKPYLLKVNNNNFNVRSINIDVTEEKRGVGVLLNQLKTKPKDSLFAFEIITNINNKEIDEVKMVLRVLKSQVGENKIKVAHNVYDKEYTEWLPIKELKDLETVQYKFYEVKTSKLSLFTVYADEKEVINKPAINSSVKNKTKLPLYVPDDTIIIKEITETESEKEWTKNQWTLLIAGIIAVSFFGIYVWRLK